MSITDDEIKHLSELARLDLQKEERENLKGDLDEILNLAEKIQEVDTENVEPTYHALPLTDVTRPDEPRDSDDPQKLLEHAPESSDGYFVVPKVIEDDE